jgi:hypothetical protein
MSRRSWSSRACDDTDVRRVWFSILVCVFCLSAVALTPALASNSTAQLWTALGGNVTCGIAIHPPNSPPMQLLCSARSVPAPKMGVGFGDPGFVFLGSTGRPSLARLSQDSFVGTHQKALGSGRKWGGIGPIEVTCTIGASSVRCVNRTRHGFTITRSSYRAF